MSDEIELVRGSANVFADFGRPNADAEHLKALLAARIIGIMDDTSMTVRAAEAATGVAAADFSRIRRARLGRFTIDRLMSILERLDQRVEVTVAISPKAA